MEGIFIKRSNQVTIRHYWAYGEDTFSLSLPTHPITNILPGVNLTYSHMGICVGKEVPLRVLSREKKIVSVAKNFSTNAIDSQHPTV